MWFILLKASDSDTSGEDDDDDDDTMSDDDDMSVGDSEIGSEDIDAVDRAAHEACCTSHVARLRIKRLVFYAALSVYRGVLHVAHCMFARSSCLPFGALCATLDCPIADL